MKPNDPRLIREFLPPPDLRPRDARLDRIKVVPCDAKVLAALLQLDGSQILTCSGWPEGAQVIGGSVDPANGEFYLVLYRDDFPIVLAGRPPERVVITIKVEPAAPAEEPPAE